MHGLKILSASAFAVPARAMCDDPPFRDAIVHAPSLDLAAVMRCFARKQLFNVSFGPFVRR